MVCVELERLPRDGWSGETADPKDAGGDFFPLADAAVARRRDERGGASLPYPCNARVLFGVGPAQYSYPIAGTFIEKIVLQNNGLPGAGSRNTMSNIGDLPLLNAYSQKNIIGQYFDNVL